VRVQQEALRESALDVFNHLHSLSLRFHTHRQTGGVLRSLERGTQGISFLLSFLLFNIMPTILELVLVCGVLVFSYVIWFALITLGVRRKSDQMANIAISTN
jgi:ATP-binding cassette subfamily B protein